jgi:hypothetical protein
MKRRIAFLKMKSLLILLSLAVCITPVLAKKFKTPPPPPQYEYPFEGTKGVEHEHYDTSAHITVGGTTYSSYCSFGADSVSCSDSVSSYSEVTLKPSAYTYHYNGGGKDGWTKEPLKNPPAQAIDPRLANVPETARFAVAKEIARNVERQGYVEPHEEGLSPNFRFRVVESGNARYPWAFCVPPKKDGMVRLYKHEGYGCLQTPGGMYYTCDYKQKQKEIMLSYYTESCFYIIP